MSGADLIAAERKRQKTDEGFSPTGDLDYTDNELARAASCYLLSSRFPLVAKPGETRPAEPPPAWPWEAEWWKPSNDPVRDLVKCGALVAAEIDRLQKLRGEG